jgi:hypothetical protein
VETAADRRPASASQHQVGALDADPSAEGPSSPDAPSPLRRRALPGWAIDLATDGLPRVSSRAHVVRETRRIMLSAHRAGWPWPDVHALLTDTDRRKFARQIATGRGGRPIARRRRDTFLHQHWADTARLVASTATLTPTDIADHIEAVLGELEHANVSDRWRAIVEAAASLAVQHGTTRPAIPVRVLVEMLGQRGIEISLTTAHRELKRICEDGEWLALAVRGDRVKANLYSLAPRLLAERRSPAPGTTATPSSAPPDAACATFLKALTPRERAAVEATLAAIRAQGPSEQITDSTTRSGRAELMDASPGDLDERNTDEHDQPQGAPLGDGHLRGTCAEPLPARTRHEHRPPKRAPMDDRRPMERARLNALHQARPSGHGSERVLAMAWRDRQVRLRKVHSARPDTQGPSSGLRDAPWTDPAVSDDRPPVREQGMREPGAFGCDDRSGEHQTLCA